MAPRYGSCGRTTGTWGGGQELLPGQTLVISYRDEPRTSAVFNGYAYPFIDRTLLDAELPYLSCLSPFTYGISASAAFCLWRPMCCSPPPGSGGTRPVMHLSTLTENGQFDAQRAALVLTDAAAQDRLAEELRQLLLRRGYAGLDVDFEFLPGDLAAPYAAFLGRLRRMVNAHGLFLWAALAPKTSAEQAGTLYEGHGLCRRRCRRGRRPGDDL